MRADHEVALQNAVNPLKQQVNDLTTDLSTRTEQLNEETKKTANLEQKKEFLT